MIYINGVATYVSDAVLVLDENGNADVFIHAGTEYVLTKVSDTPPEELPELPSLEGGYNDITLTDENIAGGSVEFQFTVTAAGEYTFFSNYFNASVYNSDGSLEGRNVMDLANGIYTVRLDINDGVVAGTYDIWIGLSSEKQTVFTATVGENTLAVEVKDIENGTVKCAFTATAAETYVFTADGLTVAVYDTDGNALGSGELDLPAGTYTVILGNVTEAGNYTLNISVKEMDRTLKVGSNTVKVREIDVVAPGVLTYTFKADTAETYVFACTGLNLFVYDAAGKSLGSGELDLPAGTYTVKVSGITEAGEYPFSISVKKIDRTLKVGSNSILVRSIDVTPGTLSYTFKATTAETYIFSCTGLTVAVYDALGNSLGNGELDLEAGTYTVKVSGITKAGSYPLSISVKKMNRTLNVGINTITVRSIDVTAGTISYIFKVDTPDTYVFNGANFNLAVYDAAGKNLGSGELDLAAGTYTVKLSGIIAQGSYSLKISVKAIERVLTVGDNSIIVRSIDITPGYISYTLTVDVAGDYKFEGDTPATVYRADGSEVGTGEVTLHENVAYTVKLDTSSLSNAGTYSLKVTLTAVDSDDAIDDIF
ncbi:MAG: hypothetical protein IJX46_09745 [Clostridia bacterium]|nr:hypothetical protein [Clostridia bacterium]